MVYELVPVLVVTPSDCVLVLQAENQRLCTGQNAPKIGKPEETKHR